MEDDVEMLVEPLSFNVDIEASTEWLLGQDFALDLADLGLDDYSDDLGEDLELPILTDLPILEFQSISPQLDATSRRESSAESTVALSTIESRLSFLTGSPTSNSCNLTLQPQNLNDRKPKQPRKYSNRARDARREELLYLRQKVTELQLQLDQLRNTHKPPTVSAPFSSVAAPPSVAKLKDVRLKSKLATMRTAQLLTGTPSATFSSIAAPMASTASSAHLASVWKDIAQRQASKRQKAERENMQLKMILEKQIKVGKSLELGLRKRQNERVKDPHAS